MAEEYISTVRRQGLLDFSLHLH